MRCNQDIRNLIRNHGFNQVIVAREIGISYSYFTRWLCAPMTPDQRHRTLLAIKRLEKQRLQKEKRVLEWFDNSESGLLGEDWYKNNAKK